MTKPKTKGQKALAAAIKAEQAQQKADLVDLLEAAPGEERAAKRRAMKRREEVLNAMSPKRKNKHGNNVSYDQDGKWDSDAEKRRWPILKAMQKDGQIFYLRRQVRIPLYAPKHYLSLSEVEAIEDTGDLADVRVGYYVADFVYTRAPSKNPELVKKLSPEGFIHAMYKAAVVEDVKGFRDALFKWKAKHFKIEYGFSITEIKA